MSSPGSRQAKATALFGAYGGINAGDEMILRALAERCRASGAGGTMNVVCSGLPKGMSAQVDYDQRQLAPFAWQSPLKSLAAVRGRDIVIGGGQIIDGVAGVRLPALQLGHAISARSGGGRVSIVGVSTARLEDPKVRFLYRRLLKLCDTIEARDEKSAADLVALAPDLASKVRVAADLVFGIASDIAPPDEAMNERDTILFAPHHSPKLKFTPVATTAKLLQNLRAALPGKRIVLALHDPRPEFDGRLAIDLQESGALDGIVVSSPETTDETIALYRRAVSVISVRMHPIIIGSCAGARCIPIESSRKQSLLAAELGIETIALERLADLPADELLRTIGVDGDAGTPDAAALSALSQAARGPVFGETI